MRVVFMGTPEFAVPTLHALTSCHDVVAVVTQPDRPSGRGKKLTPPPVKTVALEYGLPVYQFEKLNSDEGKAVMASLAPDVIVVVAYGQLLRSWLLEMPKFGCLNIHASLLPRWRGAAPIHWAIVNGDQMTGITIQQMDKGLDTGDMLLKKEVPILPHYTNQDLHDILKQEGGLLLLDALEGLEAGTLVPEKQDESQTCYAHLISRDMAKIDWTKSQVEVVNCIRGFDPWPAAFTSLGDQRYKVFNAYAYEALEDDMAEGGKGAAEAPASVDGPEAAASAAESAAPGTIIGITDSALIIKAGVGAVAVKEIQAPNGKRLEVRAFLAGHPLAVGTQFDTGE